MGLGAYANHGSALTKEAPENASPLPPRVCHLSVKTWVIARCRICSHRDGALPRLQRPRSEVLLLVCYPVCGILLLHTLRQVPSGSNHEPRKVEQPGKFTDKRQNSFSRARRASTSGASLLLLPNPGPELIHG